jgi:hypothetical protein
MFNDIVSSASSGVGIKPYCQFLNEIDRSPCTGWRWRKNGWIKTINIAGKLYVTEEAMANFRARAEAGEFSKEPKVPRLGAEKGGIR